MTHMSDFINFELMIM